jgi:hypothetical protein
LEEPKNIKFIWAKKEDIINDDIIGEQKTFLLKALEYKI